MERYHVVVAMKPWLLDLTVDELQREVQRLQTDLRVLTLERDCLREALKLKQALTTEFPSFVLEKKKEEAI